MQSIDTHTHTQKQPVHLIITHRGNTFMLDTCEDDVTQGFYLELLFSKVNNINIEENKKNINDFYTDF